MRAATESFNIQVNLVTIASKQSSDSFPMSGRSGHTIFDWDDRTIGVESEVTFFNESSRSCSYSFCFFISF